MRLGPNAGESIVGDDDLFGLSVIKLAGVVVAVGAAFIFGWYGVMAGLAISMLSIVVTGGWLIARGTRPTTGSADA